MNTNSSCVSFKFGSNRFFNAARQNIFPAPDCLHGNGFKFAARFAVDGIRPRLPVVGRPHTGALARADARPARRPCVAAVASARRHLPARGAGRAQPADLVQTPSHCARRLCGIALLPRAVPAAAHAGCPHRGTDLPALQRNPRAVRRTVRRVPRAH